MADRTPPFDKTSPAGSKFPPIVVTELVHLITENAPEGGGGGGDGNAIALNGVTTSVTGAQLNALKTKVDGIAEGATKGLDLAPTTVKTANYTAANGEMVKINSAGSSLVMTLPMEPDDKDTVGFWITNAVNDISMVTGDSAELLEDGSGIISFPLKSAVAMVGLSVWRYDSAADYWYPIQLQTLPNVSDVLGTGAAGRALMAANTDEQARDAIGALSEDALSLLFSANYTPPSFDVATSPVNQTFTSVSSGAMTGYAFDPAAGADVIVCVHGYRTQSEEITLNPTYGGVAMTPCTPMLMGNLGALNAANSAFIQFFRVPGASVDGTSKTVIVNWAATGSVTMTLGSFAQSWNGVTGLGTVFTGGGTETGTEMEQVIASAPGRVLIQSFGHETVSSAAVTGYNQTTRATMNTSANTSAVVGSATAATSVTFSATRQSGSDYFEIAFELLGSVVSDITVPTLVDVPATATSEGVYGQMAFNTTHAYVCVADDTWRRWSIASW